MSCLHATLEVVGTWFALLLEHGHQQLSTVSYRPAIISHLSNTIPEDADLRNWWLVSMGLKLPADIAYFVHVRFEDDYDAPTLPYPSCCVLTPGGMAYSAHKPGSSGHVQAMKTVAGVSIVSLSGLAECNSQPSCFMSHVKAVPHPQAAIQTANLLSCRQSVVFCHVACSLTQLYHGLQLESDLC